MDSALVAVLEESLAFTWISGGVTPISMPHTTSWRTLPQLVTAHILDGTTQIEVEGRTHHLQSGDCMCIPAGVRHCATLTSPGQAISVWSHLTYRILGAIDPLVFFVPPPVISGAPAKRIGAINRQLVELAQKELSLADVVLRKALGFDLLHAITSSSPPSPHAVDALRAAQRVAPVLAYIDAHLGEEKIDIARLASLINISESRFQAVFRQSLGTSPLRYLQSRRMLCARKLLIASDLSIGEVAQRSGYGDQFHFSRVFKLANGVNPSDYRARSAQIQL